MLMVTPLSDGKTWEVVEDYQILLPIVFSLQKLTVPKGFQFDFASTPKFLWRFFPPATGKYREPSAIHDYLYASGITTRLESDKIFLHLMKEAGVPKWKRYIMYWAVRLFGSNHWEHINGDYLR